MKRTKIDWADYAWNPVTGCIHGCPYCYAKKQTARFAGDVRINLTKTDLYEVKEEMYVLDKPFPALNNGYLAYPFGFKPTYHRYRLNRPQNVKSGSNMFVGAMADLFGTWVPDEIIQDVFSACRQAPQHNYMFLTKNMARYAQLFEHGMMPTEDNMWFGISVTNNNAEWKGKIYQNNVPHFFVSIEPILEEISPQNLPMAEWYIIGAETKTKHKIVPQKEWIDKIVEHCKIQKIPVFMKESLVDIMGADFVQEFPEGLKRVPKQIRDKVTASEMPEVSVVEE